jgi:chromosome segregation ATPase
MICLTRSHASLSMPFVCAVSLCAELERLRTEVHGFHLEMAALQAQLQEKDAHMQAALSDAAHVDAERHAAATRAEEATTAAFNLERQLQEAQNSHQEAEQARKAAAEQLAGAEARLAGLQSDQARSIRAEGELRVQLQQLQEQLGSKGEQLEQLDRQLQEAQQAKADASRWGRVT